MGLDRRAVEVLAAAHRWGVDFDATLMLGRQSLLVDDYGPPFAAARALVPPPVRGAEQFADELFRHLGARTVDSLDASPWEEATIVHDLNEPLPDAHRNRYSFVIDGGTLEHVFDYPTALRSCLEAVRPGGHFLTITPTNNFAGHGFYQLSPELFHSVLDEHNGYALREMLVRPLAGGRRFYRVADPRVVGGRVELQGCGPLLLYVLAQRTAAVPVTGAVQSDYATRWDAAERGAEAQGNRFKRFVPRRFRDPVRELMWLSWSARRLARPHSHLEPVDLGGI